MSVVDPVPYIEVVKSAETRRLPVQLVAQRQDRWRPVAVSRTPKVGFPPPISIAGPEGNAARRNYDVDEWIITDFSGGMGEETYAPAATPTSFMVGTCDTRWPRALVSRPLATRLGNTTVLNIAGIGTRVVELGYSGAAIIIYGPGTAYRWDGAAFTALAQNIRDHAIGLNGVFGVPIGAVVYRSFDGVTWTGLAGGVGWTSISQVAVFDNKLWALDAASLTSPDRRRVTAWSSADAGSAAAGSVTWTAGNVLDMPTNEVPQELFTWQYPPDKGRLTLWLLTSARLFYYDYYGATPVWQEWFVFRSPLEPWIGPGTGGAASAASSRTGNLYVALYGKEWLWEFTGSQVSRPSWNKRHGLPEGSRLAPLVIAGNEEGFYAWCANHPADLSANASSLVFMDDAAQFHHLYRGATRVVGGGAGGGKLWVVVGSGTGEVWELANPDILSVPPNVTGRTFDAAPNQTTTAWINGGLINVNKRVLHAEVDCIKVNGDPGLEPGATVQVEILTRTGTYSLGTLTAADAFPAVLAYPGGIPCKEWRVRVTLTRGTATNATAILRALKIGFRPRPKQRWTYAARIDLRDYVQAYDGSWVPNPAFAGPEGRYEGYTASALRLWVDELADNDDNGQDDALVGLAYGGGNNRLHPRRRTVSQTEVLVTAQESADLADGLYLLSFSDLTSPTSG